MKLNLADFLEQENSDIIEQHAFMKNLQKVFAELNELFGETSLDKVGFFGFFWPSFVVAVCCKTCSKNPK